MPDAPELPTHEQLAHAAEPLATTDESLAREVQKGNADAFGILMERYEARLSRYGRKFISEQEDITDTVQEVFIRAYRNMQSFDAAQKFSPWIYRIAHNTFVNALRKKSRAPFFSIDFDSLISHPAAAEDAKSETEQREMQAVVEKGLAEVAQKYREILILYYLEELSYKEIADVLQVPTSTVGIRLLRAKDALRKVYEKMNLSYEF